MVKPSLDAAGQHPLAAFLSVAAGGPARRIPRDFHVLLVEDDDRDARLTELGLSEPGDMVRQLDRAWDLASAIAQAQATPPDLVLLDLGLPDSHGLATLDAFIAAVPTVPVVVLTHLADDAVATEALDRGAQHYVIKGRLRGDLMACVMQFAIERHALLRSLAMQAA